MQWCCQDSTYHVMGSCCCCCLIQVWHSSPHAHSDSDRRLHSSGADRDRSGQVHARVQTEALLCTAAVCSSSHHLVHLLACQSGRTTLEVSTASIPPMTARALGA